MTFDIEIISTRGSVKNAFLGRDFPNEKEAREWGHRQARAIGESYDYVNIRQTEESGT